MSSSSFIIQPVDRFNMTMGQILTWRHLTYTQYFIRSKNFNKDELMGLKEHNDQYGSVYDNDFIENLLITQGLDTSKILLIAIDSSVISKRFMIDDIDKIWNIMTTFNPRLSKLIIVDTGISYYESLYKLKRSDKYNQVNNDCIKQYFKIIENKTPLLCYKTKIRHLNEVLTREEDRFFQNGNMWHHSMKNELNDNAQLTILEDISNNFKGCQTVFYTDDKKLFQKCKKTNITPFNSSML